jgi:hypothetical protein
LSEFTDFEAALSTERFGAYMLSCDNDRSKAMDLYTLNTRVSASLYAPLQALEVTLRNRFHHQLSEAYGEDWYDQHGVITQLFQRQKILSAQVDLAASQKQLTPGRIVASLTFGFWTSCLSFTYDDSLWRRGGLSKAFMAGGEKPNRKSVNRVLTPIRQLRNRIAHHEPILYFDLPKHHRNILMVTHWLMPIAAEWAAAHSTFASTYYRTIAAQMLKPAAREEVRRT